MYPSEKNTNQPDRKISGFFFDDFPKLIILTINFYQVNVEKPPCFLRKFSPDGKRFIAFSADQTSLEIYAYQV